MKEKLSKFKEYLDYVERHYNSVQKAWELIKEKCKDKNFRFLSDDYVYGLINQDVIDHDESKLSKEEFTQYRQLFFPTKEEKQHKEKWKEEFKPAWEHHKANNVHHWQNWTENHANNPHADAFLVMNVIDWVAMGFEFGDTAKEYYERNKSDIHLPDWAEILMYEIFECIYENN